MLLTGTPIQNNLAEVYSLLSFIQASIFPENNTDDFISSYARVEADPKLGMAVGLRSLAFLPLSVKHCDAKWDCDTYIQHKEFSYRLASSSHNSPYSQVRQLAFA